MCAWCVRRAHVPCRGQMTTFLKTYFTLVYLERRGRGRGEREVHAYHRAVVEIRGQFAGISPLLCFMWVLEIEL